MRALKLSLITAICVVLLLVCFGLYQYYLIGNDFLNHPDSFGSFNILIFLLTVFLFILGLISFIPSIVNMFLPLPIVQRIIPMVISCSSIVLCLYLVFYILLPEELKLSPFASAIGNTE